jgi:hypothetical protein
MNNRTTSGSIRVIGSLAIFAIIVLGSRFADAQSGEQPLMEQQQQAFEWRDGDILFQGGSSSQSRAIEQATGSSWTHCAIVFTDAKGPYVIEAVQPVKRTELDDWLKRGTGVFTAKRLADASVLTPAVIAKMKEVAAGHLGKNYDPFFQWDDQLIYCSELVWKVYKEGAGLEVGEVERFGDMELTGPDASRILKQRFGDSYPADEPVVSPASIHRSMLLRTVKEGSALAN